MFIKTFSEGNPLGHQKQYCNTAFLSSSKFCGFFSVIDIYATDCVRHLKACNVTGDQFMYILCCLFFTLYKLFFLLRVGLIYNMLDNLSFHQPFIIFLQMIAQMMLVFHRKSSFFLEIFKFVVLLILFQILQILWDRWNWNNLQNQEEACL